MVRLVFTRGSGRGFGAWVRRQCLGVDWLRGARLRPEVEATSAQRLTRTQRQHWIARRFTWRDDGFFARARSARHPELDRASGFGEAYHRRRRLLRRDLGEGRRRVARVRT
jgi:hypothetical protein